MKRSCRVVEERKAIVSLGEVTEKGVQNVPLTGTIGPALVLVLAVFKTTNDNLGEAHT